MDTSNTYPFALQLLFRTRNIRYLRNTQYGDNPLIRIDRFLRTFWYCHTYSGYAYDGTTLTLDDQAFELIDEEPVIERDPQRPYTIIVDTAELIETYQDFNYLRNRRRVQAALRYRGTSIREKYEYRVEDRLIHIRDH